MVLKNSHHWLVTNWLWFHTINIRPVAIPNTHYNDVIMNTMVSQITSLMIVYSTVYLGANQRKHQSSASLAFVWGIHRWLVNSSHKGPVSQKMFPFDDVITQHRNLCQKQVFQANWRIPTNGGTLDAGVTLDTTKLSFWATFSATWRTIWWWTCKLKVICNL